MRWTALLLSLLMPGLGHTAIGRPARGMAVSLLFTVGVVLTVARASVVESPFLDNGFTVLLAATIMIYLVCQLFLLRVLVRAVISDARPVKEDHLRAGLALVARGNSQAGEKELRRVLAIDPSDVEAHLNLAALFAQRGDARKARQHLKWCRRFDIDGKWDWEVGRELAALNGSEQVPAPPETKE